MRRSGIDRHRLLIRSALAAVVAASAWPVLAQDAADQSMGATQSSATAPATTDPASADTGGLADIVVTAERREQSLQDVPISATVLSAEDIARRGVDDASDLQQVAPSITISSVNRSTFINIRGVGLSQSAPTQSPGVAFYVDGQLIPQDFQTSLAFYDVGTIEVLRGPQGTLSGQNSTGGAIYLRTPEPRFDNISGYVEQTIADFDQFRTIGAINWGPSSNVALRVAAIHDERDSFTRNIGPSPSQPGNSNVDAIRANLALRSDDGKLRINVRGEYFASRTDNVAIKPHTGAQLSPDPFKIDYDAITFFNQRGYRLSAELRYALTGAFEVRAITSWQDAKLEDQADGDRTSTTPIGPPGGRVALASNEFDNWINEINFISTGDGPFQWVLGAFRLDGRVPTKLLRDNNSRVTFVRSNSTIDTEADNTSTSLFGQANYFVTDELEIVAGARHSWDKQVYDLFVLPGPPAPPSRNIAKSTEWTGKIGLNWQPSQFVTAYAVASKGYKAGGANLGANAANYLPERNFVYEVGLKTEIIPRRLRVNADVFYSKYKDLQLVSLLNGLPLTQNAAEGQSWGAELEVVGQLDDLGFNLGVGYLDAEFAGDVCVNNTNNPAGTRTLCPSTSATQADELVPKGRELPFSPEWTINAGAQYRIAVSDELALTPRIQWSHVSRHITTPFPSFRTVVPSRDVVDARLTLDVGERYRFEVFANNLFDETYIVSHVQNTSSSAGGFVYGAPRQIGVRATLRFGDL